jgi:hypothetical protein
MALENNIYFMQNARGKDSTPFIFKGAITHALHMLMAFGFLVSCRRG